MSLYKEYTTSLERDTDILLKKFDLDVLKLESALEFDTAYSDIFLEKGIGASKSSPSNEVLEKKKTSKWKETLMKILEKVEGLIRDFFDSFSKFFSDKHVDMEKYKNSRIGKEQLQYGYQQVSEEIARAQAENSLLVRGISKATKQDALKVKAKIDNIADIINHKVLTPKVGATILLLSGLAIGSRKEIKKIYDDAKKTKDQIKNFKETNENGKLTKDNRKEVFDIITSNVHRLATLVTKFYSALGGDITRGMPLPK